MPALKAAALVSLVWAMVCAPCLRGLAQDCDGNLVDDAEEIALGRAADCNDNGVPDDCEVEPVPYRVVRSLPVDANATGFHVADLNDDGFPDIAIGTNAGVAVRLRLPDEPDVAYATNDLPLPGRPVAWVGGDLDGDGYDDLIANNGSDLYFLYNDGSGAFTLHVTIPLSRGLEGMAIGDLDGDGRNDVVVGNSVTRTIVLLENRGDRTFGEPQALALTATPSAVTVADLDADGDEDIACDGGSSSLVVVLHDENLRFAAPLQVDVGGEQPRGVVAADVSEDGVMDLVTVSRSGVAVLTGGGEGQYSVVTYAMEGSPSAVTAGDLNDDGDLDVLASYRSPRGTFAFHNAGAGRLVGGSMIELALNLSPSHLAMHDLDMDGDNDLVLIALFAVSVVWNDGNQNTGDQVHLETLDDFEGGGPPHGGDIGDVDGDGDIDVVLGHNGNGVGGICISRNEGDGTFAAPYFLLPSIVSWTLTVVDLDGDGDLDVATSNRGRILNMENPGDGVFQSAAPVGSGGGAYYLTHADVDADGDSDLLSATGGNTVDVYRNAGDGTFPDPRGSRVGSGARGVSPFDMDGDGDIDLAVANAGSSEITILQGNGAGDFERWLTLPVLGQPNFVRATDLDGDGHPDAVSANRGGNVSVFWSLGGGQFASGVHFDVERELYSLWTGDITGDGRAELVTVTESGRSVSVLVNRGDRTFAAPVRYLVGSGPRHVRVADLDGDDDLDVVTLNRGGSSFTVLRNTPSTDESVGFVSRICTVADFFELSRSAGPFERLVRFVLPVRPESAPLGAAFLGVSRFPLHEEFFAAMLPERFPDVPRGETFDQLVGRRATREYFVGSVTRRRDEAGFFYTFTIVVDAEFDPGETLRLEEVAAIHQQLTRIFALGSLRYEPDTAGARDAAEAWIAPSFDIFFPEVSGNGEGNAPTFELEIPPWSMICGVFPRNFPGRTLREEYDAKTTLELVDGTFQLPTDSSSFEANLVTELLFGPGRLVAQPNAPGVFRLVELPAGEDTVHRFTYRQSFTLPGGDELTIQMFGLDFRSRGGAVVTRRIVLDEAFFTFGGSVEGVLNGSPLVTYSSCNYSLLPGFEIDLSTADGTHLYLLEQFLEVESELDTGPAALLSAAVTGTESTQSTDDYWRLVYAARRHNQDVRYWVLLEPPLEIANVPAPVHVVEVLTPQPDERAQPLVNYLDENFLAQATATITAFDKRPAPAGAPGFRRGDVDESRSVNIADAIVLLEFLFRDGDAPACLKAGDADDDGRLNLADAVQVLLSTTQGRTLPPPLSCGADPTADELSCEGTCRR